MSMIKENHPKAAISAFFHYIRNRGWDPLRTTYRISPTNGRPLRTEASCIVKLVKYKINNPRRWMVQKSITQNNTKYGRR